MSNMIHNGPHSHMTVSSCGILVSSAHLGVLGPISACCAAGRPHYELVDYFGTRYASSSAVLSYVTVPLPSAVGLEATLADEMCRSACLAVCQKFASLIPDVWALILHSAYWTWNLCKVESRLTGLQHWLTSQRALH